MNDNNKDLTETRYPTDAWEEGSLELQEWWSRYRVWERDEAGEFPSNPSSIRDERRLAQPCLPTQPSNLEDDQTRSAD